LLRQADTSTPSDAVDLSIVVPNFNQSELLVRCLATVVQFAPKKSEILVVDDGSTDGSADVVSRLFPQVRLCILPRNGGFCKAANAGIHAARGRIVELLNNDTEVAAGWAEAALTAFDDPSVGSVAPMVRQLPHRSRIDSAGDVLTGYGTARKRGEGKPWRSALWAKPVEVVSASASSAFYRREAVLEVGGFPEHFGAYLDDVDLGLRLRRAGYRCIYQPESVVFHWVGQSHKMASRQMLHQVSLNSERMFWGNLTAGQIAARAIPHVAYIAAILSYKALKGEFAPWFAGKCQAAVELPSLLGFGSKSLKNNALRNTGAYADNGRIGANKSGGDE
jgi:GT2 family glycosyltransferase